MSKKHLQFKFILIPCNLSKIRTRQKNKGEKKENSCFMALPSAIKTKEPK